MSERRQVHLDDLNIPRIAHNYLMQTRKGNFDNSQLNEALGFLAYVMDANNHPKTNFKVGVLMLCVNELYWPYLQPVVNDLKNQFLFGHDVEIMVWSDMPIEQMPIVVTPFRTEPMEWPMGTLMRYHTFLSEEEYLQKFDYLFYIDADMRIVNTVGDEVLGEGLTAAKHPMYALSPRFDRPYDFNPESEAYVKMPGKVVVDDSGKRSFDPLYAAGGFQGGKRDEFIAAMRAMKKGISNDLSKNYIARWNDESHWNRYLLDHEPAVVLPAAYIYPDSLIKEYYEPIWGRSFIPRIVTLTKPFTVSKEGGAAVSDALDQMRRL